MKFNAITLIWSIALMLLIFQFCLLWIDWEFTNTIAYKFMLLLDGFMFGMVMMDWSKS
jgi:amino acid transporter